MFWHMGTIFRSSLTCHTPSMNLHISRVDDSIKCHKQVRGTWMEKYAMARTHEARPTMNFLQTKQFLCGFWNIVSYHAICKQIKNPSNYFLCHTKSKQITNSLNYFLCIKALIGEGAQSIWSLRDGLPLG